MLQQLRFQGSSDLGCSFTGQVQATKPTFAGDTHPRISGAVNLPAFSGLDTLRFGNQEKTAAQLPPAMLNDFMTGQVGRQLNFLA